MLILGAFAVWFALALAEPWIEMPQWAWRAIAGALGVAWICAYDLSHWWHGVGVGGAAVVLGLVTDLFLVGTDAVRMHVLKGARR